MASPPATALAAAGLRRWRIGISALFALGGIAAAGWAARLPTVRDLLGASTISMSWLLTGIAIGSVAGLLIANQVIQRLGTRRALAVCFSVGPVAFLTSGIGVAVGSYGLVFAGLVVFGVTFSIGDVAQNVQGVATERATGRTMMPGYHAFFSLGSVAGALLGSLAEQLDVPILVQTAAVAVVMVVAGQVAVRWLQPDEVEPEDAPDAPPRAKDRSAWREPLTLALGVIAFGMAFAEGSAGDWLALSSVDGHGTSHELGAVVFGVFVTGMTAGRLAGSRIIDRFGRAPVLRATAVLGVVGLAVYIVGSGPALALVGAALWGLGASLGFPMSMSAAGQDPRRAAARVTVVSTVGYCAFLVGPPVIGFLGHGIGLLLALLPVLALVALSGLLAPAVKERIS